MLRIGRQPAVMARRDERLRAIPLFTVGFGCHGSLNCCPVSETDSVSQGWYPSRIHSLSDRRQKRWGPLCEISGRVVMAGSW